MATVLDTLVTEIIFKGDTSALENMQKRLSNFTSNLNALRGRRPGFWAGQGAIHPGDVPAQFSVGPRPPTGLGVSRDLSFTGPEPEIFRQL